MRTLVSEWRERTGVALVAPGRDEIGYRDLARLVQDFDARLVSIGIRGQVVGFLSQDQMLCALAAFAVGLSNCFAPVSPAYRGARITAMLDMLDSDVLLTDDALSFDAANGPRVLIGFDGAHVSVLRHDLAGLSPGLTTVAPIMMMTAGSTGTPKRVGYLPVQLDNTARNNAQHFGLTAADRYLCPMPLHHAHGLVSIVHVMLGVGGTTILTHGDLDATLAALDTLAPTCLSCVPTLHLDLAALIEARGRRPSGLRFARSSSAPLNYAVVERLEAAYGCPLVETYGLTESTTVVIANSPGDRRIGSVGRPIGDTRAAVLDDGELRPAGSGELVLRGKSVITSYVGSPESGNWTRGWFRTGDLAEIDADGYVRIVGRLKEMVKRGGLTVFLPEVDRALEALPGVVAARALAIGHDRMGEDLVAVVELVPGADADAPGLLARLGQDLPRYKTPSQLRLVERIPRNDVGKIVRADLVAQFAPLFAEAPVTATPAAGDDLETAILEFCAEEMQVAPADIDARAAFFDTGAMDSFSIEALLMLMEYKSGVRLRLGDPALEPINTIAELATLIRSQRESTGNG